MDQAYELYCEVMGKGDRTQFEGMYKQLEFYAHELYYESNPFDRANDGVR